MEDLRGKRDDARGSWRGGGHRDSRQATCSVVSEQEVLWSLPRVCSRAPTVKVKKTRECCDPGTPRARGRGKALPARSTDAGSRAEGQGWEWGRGHQPATLLDQGSLPSAGLNSKHLRAAGSGVRTGGALIHAGPLGPGWARDVDSCAPAPRLDQWLGLHRCPARLRNPRAGSRADSAETEHRMGTRRGWSGHTCRGLLQVCMEQGWGQDASFGAFSLLKGPHVLVFAGHAGFFS